MNCVVVVSHDEAIQELLVLRQQVAELRSAQPLTGIYQSLPSKPGHCHAAAVPVSDLAEAFDMSESLVSFILSVQFLLFLIVDEMLSFY